MGKLRNAQEAFLTLHEEEVFEARAEGKSWRKIAAEFTVSISSMWYWLKADPDRKAAWKALDELAAESQAGKAEEILEDAVEQARYGFPNSELTRLAVARSELAKWHATVLNRPRFGAPTAAGGMVLNVGTLHLTAVKELNLNPPPPPAGLISDGEFEIVEPSLEDLLNG